MNVNLTGHIDTVTKFVWQRLKNKQEIPDMKPCLEAIAAIAEERQHLDQIPADKMSNFIAACSRLESNPDIEAIMKRCLDLKIEDTSLLKHASDNKFESVFVALIKQKDLPLEHLLVDYSPKPESDSDSEEERKPRLGSLFRRGSDSSSEDLPIFVRVINPEPAPKEPIYSALHWACEHGYPDVVEALLQRPDLPIECLLPDQNGNTPLHLAGARAKRSGAESVRLLLNHPHLPKECFAENKERSNPLDLIFRIDRTRILNKFIYNEEALQVFLSSPNLPQEYISAKTTYAIFDHGNWKLARSLVERPDFSSACLSADPSGITPIHLLCKSRSEEALHLLATLLKRQDLPKECFANGTNWTLLHVAAYYGNSQALELLLAHPNLTEASFVKDRNGKTPLHLACTSGDKRTISALLNYQKLPEACFEHKEILYYLKVQSKDQDLIQLYLHHPQLPFDIAHFVCQRDDYNLLSTLLARKNLPREYLLADKDGNTPLHIACFHPSAPLVSLLLSYKDLPKECFAKNNKGKNPVDLARHMTSSLEALYCYPDLPKECFDPSTFMYSVSNTSTQSLALAKVIVQSKHFSNACLSPDESGMNALHKLCQIATMMTKEEVTQGPLHILELLCQHPNLPRSCFEYGKNHIFNFALKTREPALFTFYILKAMREVYPLEELADLLKINIYINNRLVYHPDIQAAIQKIFTEEEQLLFAPLELNFIHYTFPVKEEVPPPPPINAADYFLDAYTDEELKLQCARMDLDVFSIAGLSKPEYEEGPDPFLSDPSKKLRLTRACFYIDRLLIPMQKADPVKKDADNYLSEAACDDYGQQLSHTDMIVRMHAYVTNLVQHLHIQNTPLAGLDIDEFGTSSLDRFWNDYERYPIAILTLLLEKHRHPSYYINAIAPFAIAGGQCATRCYTEPKQVYVRLYREEHPEVPVLGLKDLMASELQRDRLAKITKMAIDVTNSHFHDVRGLTTHLEPIYLRELAPFFALPSENFPDPNYYYLTMFYAIAHHFNAELRLMLHVGLTNGDVNEETMVQQEFIKTTFIRVSKELFETKYYNGDAIYASAKMALKARESEDDFPEFLASTLHELFRPLILALVTEEKPRSHLEKFFVKMLKSTASTWDIDYAMLQTAFKDQDADTLIKCLGPFEGVDPKDAPTITQRTLDLLLEACVSEMKRTQTEIKEDKKMHLKPLFFLMWLKHEGFLL